MVSPDLPMHLGLCRSCARLRVLRAVTFDCYGSDADDADLIYYCRANQHRTEGKGNCNSYAEKSVNKEVTQ